jgi:S-adenosylmethionine-dependent methyltransferase
VQWQRLQETLEHVVAQRLLIVPLLAADGQLSLLFYNRHAAFLKRVLRGELGVALQELEGDWQPRGWGKGCVPWAETEVRAWLAELGLVVRSRAGIRIFHDHVPAEVRGGEGFDTLLKLEHACSREEPFASLGQHMHLTCERVASPG